MENRIKLNEAVPENTRIAIELHTQIMQHGKTAATAMVEFSRGLKRMRDEKLYEALGCTSFDVYVDEVVGIGQRQAYTYIRALEQLGPSLMEEQAHLGITKLEILAQVYAVDRAAFLEENNVEEMSVKEMRELTAKLKDTGEQLSFMTEENERLKEELADGHSTALNDAAEHIDDLKRRISELEAQLEESDEKDEHFAERLREAHEEGQKAEKKRAEAEKRAAVAAAEKKAAEKYNQAIATANAAKKQAEDALKEAKREAYERVAKLTAAAHAEKSATAARAAELEKRLKIAADPDTTAVAVYVEEVGGLLNKALAKITAVKQRDGESGAKLAGAMCRVMDTVRPQFEALYTEG